MGIFQKHSSSSSKPSLPRTTSSTTSNSTSSHEQMMHNPNISTSNLSTTSTLLNAPAHTEHEESVQREAEQRRRVQKSLAWPDDPWRGGFGPSASQEVRVERRVTSKEERREARREIGEWLKGNGLRRWRS